MQAAVRTHQSPAARASSSPQSPVLRTSCAAARLEIQPRARLLRPPAAAGLEIQPRRRLKPLLASPGDTLRNGRPSHARRSRGDRERVEKELTSRRPLCYLLDAPPPRRTEERDVAGNSGENEGSKKAKKKIKKKGNLCGFKSRFNSKRLAQIGKQFKHKNKSITFSKLMVKRIFNVPFGDRPVKLLKKSDEHDLRSIYKEGNRAPIAHVVKLLTSCSEEDVVMINRTWALLVLATVLCPGTGNMVNLEYLASLEDMSLVHEFAWDEHLLARAMEEVGVFQEKKRMQANTEKEFQIASCLPMLAIIYMDHVDIPVGLPNEHAIDYSVPRIRFVCQKDFEWLDKVDKNKLTLVQPFYGKHTHFMEAFLFMPLMFCFPRSGVCATPPMQHNLWDRKLVLKQLLGRELVLKHLILLKQDPTTFQPAKLIPELERAVTKFKANKYDLLFVTIVHEKHWIIVCANLLYKQWNVFDSIHSKGKQSPLKKQTNNLITNFAALAQEYSQFNVNVGSFARVDLEDYPKQDNLKMWRDTAWMWRTTFALTQ
ncbi:uncharacterized protein LOC119350153 [Triticum dicoccoides]|uniref:uncharacterized protein LOC119350153 n=1 Tax=Triticum dicoccoides TaxID=85692 RepID=UPI0018905342|nr:uncharacterized protein LOC119350153 [Triticum dicoccoides]